MANAVRRGLGHSRSGPFLKKLQEFPTELSEGKCANEATEVE